MPTATLDQIRQDLNAGRVFEAAAACRQILQTDSNQAEAWHYLGIALYKDRKFDESVDAINRAIQISPQRSDFQCNLGVIYAEAGRFADAVAPLQSALRVAPDSPQAWNNLAVALEGVGRFDEAAAAANRAIGLIPNFPDAYSNLGNALLKSGRFDEAVAAHRKALELQPEFPQAYNNLAHSLRAAGKGAEAIAAVRKAIALKPDYAEAYDTLGSQLQAEKLFDEAVAAFEKALQLRPDFARAAYNMANALNDAGKIEESIAAFRKAANIDPNIGDIQHNLARALLQVGELDAALAAHDRAIALRPDHPGMHGAKLFALHFHPRFDPPAILREARIYNDRHARPFAGEIAPHRNDKNPERRLKIGYVSPDFRTHCQSFFTTPLLSHHDHSRYEIFCYADIDRPDATTARLQSFADVWRPTHGFTDTQIAAQIREDQIDILVDLTMHMGGSRPLIFARKPAPVQVTWLAYPGTTGLEAIDYRLSDPYLDPIGEHDNWYSENTWRLPETFWCYDPLSDQPAVNELPALSREKITFGCFNNFCKLNDVVLEHWHSVLDAVGGSRLILLAPPGKHRDHVLQKLGDRVEFISFLPRDKYLQAYHRVDLGLDTYPYNGHTTSLDSLWMGVPVISLYGSSAVSRAGLSQTTNLGLQDEFAAQTPEQFTALAVKWAGNFAGLADLRRTLRARMQQSPLMDAARFARNIESAFGEMWGIWCGSAR
jgi:predicted O-linked N-acetylglucosamine transferase (SPINDLY family)